MTASQARIGSAAFQGPNEPAAQAGPEYVGPAVIRIQLERIVASSEFIGSDRTRRFLRYVVEEALAGRGDRIKAFSVAVAAFDRDESFDPQTDPIVRIEAGRLRRSLERYYLVAGVTDPVRIDIPKGTYVPQFSWLSPQQTGTSSNDAEQDTEAQSQAAAYLPLAVGRLVRSPRAMFALISALVLIAGAFVVTARLDSRMDLPRAGATPALPRPSVAVLPFGISGAEQTYSYLSSGMTNELIRELSQYSNLYVLGPQSIQRLGTAPDVTVVGAESGARFVLLGDIQHVNDKIRVSVRLNDTETGGVIWAESYDRKLVVERVFDLQVEIAREIVRKIAQPQGAIALFDWKRTRGMAPEAWEAHDCVVQADELHRRVLPPAQEPAIRACLRRAVEQEPGYADAWVMLALIEIDAARFSPLATQSEESLDLAYAAAKRAVDLAPDSGRAHLALMMAQYFRGAVEPSLAAGYTAVQLSPRDPDVLGEVGLRQIVSGDLHAGMNLVEQAIGMYESAPLSYRLGIALGYLRKGHYQEASDAVLGPEQAANFVYWSVVSAIHGKAGRLDEARQAAGELLKLYPDFADRAWTELEARNVSPELAATMVEGWRAAGLDVPTRSAASMTP